MGEILGTKRAFMLFSENTVRFIDLFSGMGGFRLGFEQAAKSLKINTKCVFSSEIKEYAVKVYEDNFNDKPHGDITKIPASDIPDFDVLLAGFPCQAFSSAGKRQGFLETRGTMFFEIERILKEKRPEAFILENVEGLINHDKENKDDSIGRTLETILNILTSLNYTVSWKLFDSSEYGLAQARKRVFIVGSLNHEIDLDNFKKSHCLLKDILEKNQPILNTNLTKLLLDHFQPHDLYGKSIKDKRGGANNIHSWDIELKGSCSPEQRHLMSELLKVRRYKKWAEIKGIEWMDGMPLTLEEISTFYEKDSALLQLMLDDLVEKKYLKYEHPKDIVEVLNDNNNTIKVREYRYDLPKGYNIVAGKMSYEISKILDPEDISPTLVAMDIDKIAVVDNHGLRKLTNTEQKRLFGFPDNFDLSSISQKEKYDLFGNTVPVPIVEMISQNILKAITNHDQPFAYSQQKLF